MRRVRVAHVITRLCKGGAQENTVQTVKLADRARFDVDLIAGYTREEEPNIEDTALAGAIAIIRVPHLVRNPSPRKDWAAYRELTDIFRNGRYDIVHTHTSKAGYLGRLAAAKAGVPIIFHTPHGHIFFGYFNRALTALYTRLERHAARKTDCLIALTRRGIEEHLAHSVGRPDQWVPVFSGIDLAPFDHAIAQREATRAALGIGPNEILIGAVGRLEPVKGFAYFVDASLLVAEASESARFILVGDGALRAELESRAKPLGTRFQFLGMRDDVPELMAAMDICVVPSLNEGMGRVILEAGAAGTPVVASRVGGIPEIVQEPATGLLVRPRDATGISSAALSLVHSAERRARMGSAARGHARGYSLASMVEKIESLYDNFVREKLRDA
ncbi:MAG: glycosyltransferase family 4 protein [Candidatus Hydrogenedentes bacterium]|nr:glycosyltransferase family 4 protein [Candidatus Hydrogenedentota bacterium]